MEKPRMLRLALSDPQLAVPSAASAAQARNADSESLVYHRVRRQVVQHGFARHRGKASTKEGHQHARLTRLERQIAIVENYHREKARHEARLRATGDSRDVNQEHLSSSSVIIEHPISRFPRKSSLRQLSPNRQTKNQHEESLAGSSGVPLTMQDVGNFAVLASQPVGMNHGPTSRHVAALVAGGNHPATANKPGKNEASSSARVDKTTAQVLLELRIMKDITMREQLVTQIHEGTASLNQLATDLHDLAQRKAKFELSGASASIGSLARRPSVSMLRPKSGNAIPTDPTRRDAEVPDWEAKSADLTHNARHCVTQLDRLIQNFRSTTMNLVEAIIEWRASKSQPSTILSNAEKHYRFGWEKSKITNYLAHMDFDLRDLFPSPVMSVLLGTTAKYNPLLLSQATLNTLGIAEDTFVSTTFLTDRHDGSQLVSREVSALVTPSPAKEQVYVALLSAVRTSIATMAPSPSQADMQRLRQCLEAIGRERELERTVTESLAAEKHRVATAYNPFESIKIAGGVEDVISNVLALQPEAETGERAELLRRRQEDTSRAKEYSCLHKDNQDDGSFTHAHSLFVNPGRLRRLIEQRKEVREAMTDCELRDTTASWRKNKLRGQVMVRKMNIRRTENHHARTIQQQYLVYRRRTQLLKNLAQFVVASRQRVVSIQKLVRGFIAKQRYTEAKRHRAQQHQRRRAARTIWYTYKRYKRRVHHRRSLSVETVAHIQLFHVIQHHEEDVAVNEPSSTERYRKLGEERRRQRALDLYKRRQELMVLEAKRAVAAVRIQSIYRMHLAKRLAIALRGERRAHLSSVSAMMIQSKIRAFLKLQEKRRKRFRSDMERVNRSAVRIQSIYRGYNSRAGLLDELNALAQSHAALYGMNKPLAEEKENEDVEEDSVHTPGQSYTTLPPIFNSRPSTASSSQCHPLHDEEHTDLPRMSAQASISSVPKVSLPPIRPRVLSEHRVETHRKAHPPSAVRRQPSTGMTKVELKLKETTLGDDLESTTHGHGGFMGPLRRRLSSTTSGSPFSRGSVSSSAGSKSPRR